MSSDTGPKLAEDNKTVTPADVAAAETSSSEIKVVPATVVTTTTTTTPADGRITGICKFWNHRGYGFLVPDDGGDDVFCHFREIVDGNCLKEGTKVTFKRVWDPVKNKHRAEGLTGGLTDVQYSNTNSGPAMAGTGTVKLWNADKGFGFVVADDTRITEDIFVHFRGIMDGDSLNKGEKVAFNMVKDEVKGNYKGDQVRRIAMGMNSGFMMPNTGAAYMDPSMVGARMQNQPYGGGMGYNNQLGFNSQAGFGGGYGRDGGYGGGYGGVQGGMQGGGGYNGSAGYNASAGYNSSAVNAIAGAGIANTGGTGFNAAPGSQAHSSNGVYGAPGYGGVASGVGQPGIW